MPTSSHSQTQILQEVAQRADVSISTVQRVLNGDTKGAYPKIAKRNQRIKRIADQLNYRPTFRGRTFQGGKTMNVALLYSHEHPMLGGFYGDMVRYAIEALQARDYHLTLWGLKPEDLSRSDLFLDRRFDGFLVHDRLSDTIREAIERAALPTILLNAIDGNTLASMAPDDKAGSRSLTEYLLKLGHRRITFFTAQDEYRHFSVTEREAGYSEVMQGHGLQPLVIELDYMKPFTEISALLGPDAPTAAVFYLQRHAFKAQSMAQSRGWSVPDDLSIATFAAGSGADLLDPAMTSVEVPFDEMGRLAAERLVDLIQKPDTAVQDQRFDTRLCIRGSTAAPRGASGD